MCQAETPDGGVITSTRNEDYHKGYAGSVECNCRGVSRSTDGGTSFAQCQPAPALVSPPLDQCLFVLPLISQSSDKAIRSAGAGGACLPSHYGDSAEAEWADDLPREPWCVSSASSASGGALVYTG